MDPNIIRQYLSGLGGANNRFLLENSRYLGNLPQNIVYNGLVYTLNLSENAFINQFGHRIDPSAAPAFITEARAFEQQNLAILDISASSSDSSSSRPTPSPIVVAAIQDFGAIPDPKDPTEGTLLSWIIDENQTDNVDEFEVLRSTSIGGPFVSVEIVTIKGARAFEDTKLDPDTTYYYQIRAIYKEQPGALSPTVSIKTETVKPTPVGITAPSGLTALNITQNSLNLRWTDNSTNELGFFVEQSLNGSTYALLEAVGVGITFAGVVGLTQDQNYWFRVQAYATGSTSAYSNVVNIRTLPTAPSAPSSLVAYTSVPETKNYLRYTQGFTTSVSTANGGWTSAGTPTNSTTVSVDNSITAPDGSMGAALLRVNNNTIIGGIHSIVNEPGVTANDLWTGSVWLRGNTSTSGSINVVARKGSSQTTIPSTIKILSGPGTVIPGATGQPHWNGVTGLSKTEWTRIAWNNITGWGPTGFTDVLLRLTVNFYSGTNPSAVTGDSIYVWGAQFERNPYPTAYLAATGGSFSTRAFQGFTSQANLYWTDNSTNESGFLIERSTNDVTYAGVTSVAANTTIYSDVGLSAGSTYFYRVSAFNAGGTSATTKSPSVTTFPNPPATPSFTSISGTTNSITLNWNNVANETGYGLYRSETLAGTYTGITTLGANVTTFVNTGLSSGTTFFYKIDAFNSGGTSALSGATSFTTATFTPIPIAPSNLRFTGRGSGKLIFAWDDNSSDENGFVIQSSPNGSSYTTLDTVGAGVTNYDAFGLSSGTTYFFQVAAFNAGGTSSFAGPTAWKTLPVAPSNFTATTGSTSSINLSWTDVTGEDGYVLNRGLTSAFTTFTGITLAANATAYSDTGLCAGTTYWYRIYSFLNDGGTSTFAGPTFAVTQEIAGGTPSAPTGFTATSAGIDSITLQWTDTATNEDGFLIYYRGIT